MTTDFPLAGSSAGSAPTPAYPISVRARAWAVHAFTMTGLLWAILAVVALKEGNYRSMWGWLVISLIVDAADGPMARKFRAVQVIPWFSGELMDNIVDYLTWTFIPVLFMIVALPLGPGALPLVAAFAAAASSMFCYCNEREKSADWYFIGFPAAWNVVILILWLLGTGVAVNWTAVVVFTVRSIVPWALVHPFRVKKLRPITATAAALWVATTAILVYLHPGAPLPGWIIWWIAGLWILGVSALRSIRMRPDFEA